MPPPEAFNNLPGYRGMEGQGQGAPWQNIMGKGPAMDPGYNQGGVGAINEAARLAGMYAVNGGQNAPASVAANLAGMYGKTPNDIQSGMYTVPNMPQMPQASANMGGRYRLSPGVYGTQQQAMNQYNQQMQQMSQPIPGLQNGLGQQGNMPPSNWVPYTQRRG
jgi:hypothetical protein